MTRLAGIELGGTKADVVLAEGGSILARERVATTDPQQTLGALAERLKKWNAEHPIEALGIASFGPVRIDSEAADYGHILQTVKPGWSGADVLGALALAVSGPAALHTDVTAAALAEGRWGAAQGCRDHVYITVGTGIGVGIVAGGRPVTGTLHPEGGHIRVRRFPNDDFAGTCPFHGDCLEGLASGPAIAARWGCDPRTLTDQDPRWEPVIEALAEGCSTLLLLLATERIVLGGGVITDRPWIAGAVASRTAAKLGNYLPGLNMSAPVVAAGVEAGSGILGALLLAEEALSDRSCQPV